MITDKGKAIISKYLIGQAPSYASYIAIGCGATPLKLSDTLTPGDYATKKNLDFEMFRVPIISKGLVSENGVSKIVLTAEMPTEERYEISEIGVFPSASNPSAQSNGSKILATFTGSEDWEYHTSTNTISAIELYPTRLNSVSTGPIDVPDKAFIANSDNATFAEQFRVARLERPRVLNESIIVEGALSDLSISGGHVVVGSSSDHIHLFSSQNDLSRYSPLDEIHFVYSVINKEQNTDVPDSVIILVEFSNEDPHGSTAPTQFARLEINESSADFLENRYFSVTKALGDLYRSGTDFSWASVTTIRVMATVLVGGVKSSDFYVAIDGMRVENISSENALYGMTGYTIVQNSDETGLNPATVIKKANTSNFVEFRFVADVV